MFNENGITTHHIYLIVVEANFVKEQEHVIDHDSDVNAFDWFTLDEIKDLKIVESNRIFFEKSSGATARILEQAYEKR